MGEANTLLDDKTKKASSSNLSEAILFRLTGVKGPDSEGNYLSLCPYHEEKHPSLSFNPTKGCFLCFGCGSKGTARALAERLGIAVGTLTIKELSEAKNLPVGWLQKVARQGKAGVEVPYLDESGQEVALRTRLNLTDSETTTRFRWRRGDHPTVYGVWGLEAQRRRGFTILVEGESDTWTLWHHGFPALGIPGASMWRPEWSRYLEGFERVYLWLEPDSGGKTFLEKIGRDLPEIMVIEAPDGAKDPSALYLKDPSAFKNTMSQLMETSRQAKEILVEQADKEWQDNYTKAQHLIENPLLLAEVVRASESLGVVGERKNVGLLYLGLVSRCLSRPINTKVYGPSSGGKSYLVNTVVSLHAPEAVYVLTSGSERSFIFSDDDLSHRFIYLQEAKGVHPGEVGQAILHEIAWGNRIRYAVVEKTEKGLKHRVVEKQGPIGILLTCTRPLESEMETRFLTVTVKDTPAQNLDVLLAISDRRNGHGVMSFDYSPFHALSRVMARPIRVNIRYGRWLAQRIPHNAVSIRRAFELFLTLIEASAILHQANRPHSQSSGIMATVSDYAVALCLAGDSLLAVERGGITPGQLEAVEVIKKLHQGREEGQGVTLSDVARELHISKGAVHQRLSLPLRLGLVVNGETRRGYPACFLPGMAVEDIEPMPSPHELAEAFPELVDDWQVVVEFLSGGVHPGQNDLNTSTVYVSSYLGTVKEPQLNTSLTPEQPPTVLRCLGTVKGTDLNGSPECEPALDTDNRLGVKAGLEVINTSSPITAPGIMEPGQLRPTGACLDRGCDTGRWPEPGDKGEQGYPVKVEPGRTVKDAIHAAIDHPTESGDDKTGLRGIWRTASIPCWQSVYEDSLRSGDSRRADYARNMLKDLGAHPDNPPGRRHFQGSDKLSEEEVDKGG